MSVRIWLDADACPNMVKEVVFKAGIKRNVPVTLVANSYLQIPRSPLVNLVVVEKNFDEADKHISENASPGDLVVTADVPLAAEIVEQKIVCINPRGKVYTPANIKEALSMRNLMEELRGGGFGTVQGGPPPLGQKDKEKFANSFDRELTRLISAYPTP